LQHGAHNAVVQLVGQHTNIEESWKRSDRRTFWQPAS